MSERLTYGPNGGAYDIEMQRAGWDGRQKSMDLAAEVAALREEIRALRAELAPVPSLILTGRQVLDEFKRLAGASA